MSILADPELLKVNIDDVTSAAANTIRTINGVIAAPPANNRTRIYAMMLAFDLNVATPANNTAVLVRFGNIPSLILSIGFPQQPSDRLILPQGVTLVAVCNLQTWSSVALAGGVPFKFSVIYQTEGT